jgi:predicted nucleic acid-binding protein
VSQWIVDASLTLGWFLEDEQGREYSLSVLDRLNENDGIVPFLWTYEVGNGLVMAHRRKRITLEQVTDFLDRLRNLPITVELPDPDTALRLPTLALEHNLTGYDAAYLELAVG